MAASLAEYHGAVTLTCRSVPFAQPLDRGSVWAFNGYVAESWSVGNRVFIEDIRQDGTYLRVTWHPDREKFVVSHWRDDVCLAATRADPSAAPDLIALLARGLGDAAATVKASSGLAISRPRAPGLWSRLRRAILARVRQRHEDPDSGPTELRWRRSA